MHWAAPEYAWLLMLAVPAALLLRHARARQRIDLARLLGENQAPRERSVRRMLASSLPLSGA